MPERVLVVEDRIKNAMNAHASLAEAGLAVDVAFDLEQAFFLMGRCNYSGIITDMAFQERGANYSTYHDAEIKPYLRLAQQQQENSEDFEDAIKAITNERDRLRKQIIEAFEENLQVQHIRPPFVLDCMNKVLELLDNAPLPPSLDIIIQKSEQPSEEFVQERFVDALQKSRRHARSPRFEREPHSLDLIGDTSDELRNEVIKKSLSSYTYEHHQQVRRLSILDGSLDNYNENLRRIETLNGRHSEMVPSATNPALGYFVVKRAQEMQIPIVGVSSRYHTAHSMPASIAAGLVSLEELERHNGEHEKSYIDRSIGSCVRYLKFTRLIVTDVAKKTNEIYSEAWKMLLKVMGRD